MVVTRGYQGSFSLPTPRRALSHYQLDGWVTEHVQTQLEISNVYR